MKQEKTSQIRQVNYAVIQPLVVRAKRHLKVVTLNMVTDAENPAPGAETTGLRHLKLL